MRESSQVSVMWISIHAPTRGATMRESSQVGEMRDFNPRSHKGSDGEVALGIARDGISIHAPTRGATILFQ